MPEALETNAKHWLFAQNWTADQRITWCAHELELDQNGPIGGAAASADVDLDIFAYKVTVRGALKLRGRTLRIFANQIHFEQATVDVSGRKVRKDFIPGELPSPVAVPDTRGGDGSSGEKGHDGGSILMVASQMPGVSEAQFFANGSQGGRGQDAAPGGPGSALPRADKGASGGESDIGEIPGRRGAKGRSGGDAGTPGVGGDGGSGGRIMIVTRESLTLAQLHTTADPGDGNEGGNGAKGGVEGPGQLGGFAISCSGGPFDTSTLESVTTSDISIEEHPVALLAARVTDDFLITRGAENERADVDPPERPRTHRPNRYHCTDTDRASATGPKGDRGRDSSKAGSGTRGAPGSVDAKVAFSDDMAQFAFEWDADRFGACLQLWVDRMNFAYVNFEDPDEARTVCNLVNWLEEITRTKTIKRNFPAIRKQVTAAFYRLKTGLNAYGLPHNYLPRLNSTFLERDWTERMSLAVQVQDLAAKYDAAASTANVAREAAQLSVTQLKAQMDSSVSAARAAAEGLEQLHNNVLTLEEDAERIKNRLIARSDDLLNAVRARQGCDLSFGKILQIGLNILPFVGEVGNTIRTLSSVFDGTVTDSFNLETQKAKEDYDKQVNEINASTVFDAERKRLEIKALDQSWKQPLLMRKVTVLKDTVAGVPAMVTQIRSIAEGDDSTKIGMNPEQVETLVKSYQELPPELAALPEGKAYQQDLADLQSTLTKLAEAMQNHDAAVTAVSTSMAEAEQQEARLAEASRAVITGASLATNEMALFFGRWLFELKAQLIRGLMDLHRNLVFWSGDFSQSFRVGPFYRMEVSALKREFDTRRQRITTFLQQEAGPRSKRPFSIRRSRTDHPGLFESLEKTGKVIVHVSVTEILQRGHAFACALQAGAHLPGLKTADNQCNIFLAHLGGTAVADAQGEISVFTTASFGVRQEYATSASTRPLQLFADADTYNPVSTAGAWLVDFARTASPDFRQVNEVVLEFEMYAKAVQ